MDAIRKQLDQLMGANRNGDVLEVSRKYYDRDVCRLYLAGLCPHDLFQLTVSVPPPLPARFHSRADLERSTSSGFSRGSWVLAMILILLLGLCFAEDGHGAVPEAALAATAQRVSLLYLLYCIVNMLNVEFSAIHKITC